MRIVRTTHTVIHGSRYCRPWFTGDGPGWALSWQATGGQGTPSLHGRREAPDGLADHHADDGVPGSLARQAWLAERESLLYDGAVTREEVQRRLAGEKAELAALGVRALDLFGSVARGETGPHSDVDLLVDFDRPVGLFHFFRVPRHLQEILGCRVDLVMRDAVKPQLRDRIFSEAVRAV